MGVRENRKSSFIQVIRITSLNKDRKNSHNNVARLAKYTLFTKKNAYFPLTNLIPLA
jgi:hypothetical protein